MREVIKEDFETVEYDVLRSDAEFSEFGDISNVQEPHVRQCLFPLQSSEIATQLQLTSPLETRDTSSTTVLPMSGRYLLNVAMRRE